MKLTKTIAFNCEASLGWAGGERYRDNPEVLIPIVFSICTPGLSRLPPHKPARFPQRNGIFFVSVVLLFKIPDSGIKFRTGGCGNKP